MMKLRSLNVIPLLALLACSQRTETGRQPAPDDQPEPAPWQATPLSAANVPPTYANVWSQAANKNTCALIAFAQHGQPHAAPRAATFSGGWAVAYDLPNLRSAFGIAGAGVNADDATYDAWPHKRTWADGSSAGYGPEGGSGPNQLAYLRIAGQGCLYNVWSRISVQHLESLLESIRFVR